MRRRPANIVLLTLILFCSWLPGAAKGPGRAGRPEIVAHRGASHDAPENTLASVNLAWQRKSPAVEVDVYLSADGHVVVYHDKTTERIGGRNRGVKDQTLAELRELDAGSWKSPRFKGELIPTLPEVLETVPAGGRLFIEIKDGVELVPSLVELLEQWQHTRRRAVVIAFSYDVAKAVKKSIPEIPVYWLVKFEQSKTDGSWEPDIGGVIARTREAGLDGIDTNFSAMVTQELIARVHAEGLGYYVYTVDDPQDARYLRDAGIDGITTNRPAWLKREMRGGGAGGE